MSLCNSLRMKNIFFFFIDFCRFATFPFDFLTILNGNPSQKPNLFRSGSTGLSSDHDMITIIVMLAICHKVIFLIGHKMVAGRRHSCRMEVPSTSASRSANPPEGTLNERNKNEFRELYFLNDRSLSFGEINQCPLRNHPISWIILYICSPPTPQRIPFHSRIFEIPPECAVAPQLSSTARKTRSLVT